MLTNLLAVCRSVAPAEPHLVPDPWGVGVVFRVRDIDATKFAERLREASRQAASGRLNRQAAQVAGLMRQAAQGLEELDVAERAALAALSQASPEDLASLDREGDEFVQLVAEELLDGWTGLSDEQDAEVPFSVETAVELLTNAARVPAGQPHAGSTLGHALCALIVAAAYSAKQLRAAAVEEKKSASRAFVAGRTAARRPRPTTGRRRKS